MRVLGASWLAELHGQAGFPVLRTRLALANERAGDVRAAAISALGRARDTESAAVLRKMLRDPQEPVGIRSRAAVALGHLGLEDALDDLMAVLRAEVKAEDDKKLDSDAIRAIGCIGTPKAIQMLAGIVKGADLDRACNALSALEDCGSPAVPVVIDASRDSRERVAERAATALGYLMKTRQEKERAEPALTFLRSDDEAGETRAARIRDGAPDLPEADCRAILAALEQSLSNSNAGVRNNAAGALAKVPGKAASEAIARIVAASSSPPTALLEALGDRREPNAAAVLTRFIRPDAPNEVCEAACRNLGELRAAQARGDLEKLAMNTAAPESSRQAALRALEKLDGGPSEECLLALARGTKGSLRWDALGRLCDSRSAAAQAAVAAALAETAADDKYQREALQKHRDRATARGANTLAARLASKDDSERAEAFSEVRDRQDRSALPDVKRAAVAETDSSCLWRVRAVLADMGCRDADLVRPMVDKLKSGPEGIRRPVAAILRYLTGVTNGPFTNETDAEIAEDIAAWEAHR
jgi:HEAT repeat protein